MKNKKRETEPVQEPTSVSPLLAKGGGRACGETIFFDGTSYTPHYAAPKAAKACYNLLHAQGAKENEI